MENPIKMDDLGVPLFSETPFLRLIRKNCQNIFSYVEGIRGAKDETIQTTHRHTPTAFWLDKKFKDVVQG